MSSRKHKKHDPDQDQDQDQKQAELQAQLQAQGQLQGQAQGQGQYQFALSENKNENDNDNENKNESSNENENKNENSNENELKNDVDNKVDNAVDNDLDNKVENTVENTVETKVDTDVDVDVKVDLDLDSLPTDDDVIDIDWIKDIDGSIVMPDVVTQDLRGDGNQFNIDQVNNLVDKDFLWSAEVKNDGKLDLEIKAEGGESKIDDIRTDVDGRGNTLGDIGTATADAVASQEAFTQNIVMGANIQFNSIEMTVAGDDLSSNGDDVL